MKGLLGARGMPTSSAVAPPPLGPTVCSADKAPKPQAPLGSDLLKLAVLQLAMPWGPPLRFSSHTLPKEGAAESPPLKAQLPPKGRSTQPCPGSGSGSTAAKKTLSVPTIAST